MKIKDSTTYKNKVTPITFVPADPVQKALDVMCKKNIGSVVIVNKDHTVAGIVTERDMMIRVLGKKLDTKKTALSKIMTKDVSVANENDDIVDWMRTMTDKRFRHLPIVDEKQKLVSLLSQGDFMAYTWPDLYDKLKQDIKCRVSKYAQVFLLLFTILTLAFIAMNY